MSISAKLADYEASLGLLGRLTFDELMQLAKRNGIELQKEDTQGNIHKAKSKEEAIEILVASEFRESDLIELLGVNRLTKEELLNLMTITQLKKIAGETGILLEKSTLFGVKKANKKKDIIKALDALSVQKIRRYAEKAGIIRKNTMKNRKRKLMKIVTKKSNEKTEPRKKKMTHKKTSSKTVSQLAVIPSRVEEKKVTPIVIPPRERHLDTSNAIEETIREVRIEKQIVRRQLSLRQKPKEKKTRKISIESKKTDKKK